VSAPSNFEGAWVSVRLELLKGGVVFCAFDFRAPLFHAPFELLRRRGFSCAFEPFEAAVFHALRLLRAALVSVRRRTFEGGRGLCCLLNFLRRRGSCGFDF